MKSLFVWRTLALICLQTAPIWTWTPGASESNRINFLDNAREATRAMSTNDDITWTRSNCAQQSAQRRRLLSFLATAATVAVGDIGPSNASPIFAGLAKFSAQGEDGIDSFYMFPPIRNATNFNLGSGSNGEVISSELVQLKLIPVRNALFRELKATLESLLALRVRSEKPLDAETWNHANQRLDETISNLDKKRGQLRPYFNPLSEEDTLKQITKNVRCEALVESLRQQLVELEDCTASRNTTRLFRVHREALLTLADVGELLVSQFPYQVPTEAKFSYLPRLQGRARVTFSFRRGTKALGNVTILADGFGAPITAGNFVDLAIRNFYTGLPIKNSKRRLGSASTTFEVANLPILGSFQEGFYDPLTATLRRIPLEMVRLDKSSGVPNLSYARGLSTLNTLVEPADNSRPLLSFNIPGIVAMNHPDKNYNGASSEFFSLQAQSVVDGKRSLLDGEFAPFGYIVQGYDLFQSLQPNDVIDHTVVDEWGQMNLVKLRRSSFSEVVEGSATKAVDGNSTDK